jgi:hypothetical protein
MLQIYARAAPRLILFTLVLALGVAYPLRAGFRPDTILSIAVQGNHIVASTSLGLSVKTSGAKAWSAMPLPPRVRPGGCLNLSDVETAPIFYSPPAWPLWEWSDRCIKGWGLWKTTDFGRTWIQVDRTHVFTEIWVHRSGVIYAVGRLSAWIPERQSLNERFYLLSSIDEGASWTIESGKEFDYLSLFRCETNPDHVCGIAGTIDGATGEYAPERKVWTFNRWVDPTFMPPAMSARFSDQEYLKATMTTGTSPFYVFRANLQNWSLYPFGSRLSLQSIQLSPLEKNYKFRSGEPANVRTTVEFMPVDPPLLRLELPDVDETNEFWGVKYIDPGGKRGGQYPEFSSFDKIATNATAHVLKVKEPYRKEIDLTGLMNLQMPGHYRVQLIFNNSAALKSNDAQWTGYLSSEPFTVEIIP